MSLLAYLRVLIVWSALELPGDMHAIMMILVLSAFIMKESRSTIVSFDALNGIWVSELFFFMSKLRMHSFSAKRLLLISAPSRRLYRLLLWQSAALSEPAKSTRNSLPISFPFPSLTWIWQIACERDEVSLDAVACVVLSEWANSIIEIISSSVSTNFSSNPWIWIFWLRSSKTASFFLPSSKSNSLPP